MINNSFRVFTFYRFEYGFQRTNYRQHLYFIEKKLLKVGDNMPYIPFPKYVKKL